jgi:cyclopropane-fatty-acyl-phospholipid synthase
MRGLADRPLPYWARTLDGARWAARRMFQFNPVIRARRNARHHYDIDLNIYDLFLDSDKQYSCAYFTPGADLETAQLAKKRHIAAKLALSPGQRVLDIGSGWGGLGLYLARVASADVTGITLSEEQLRYARARAERESQAARAKFELEDYRRVRGRFDRIVSVGMFEHVGVNHFKAYFRKIRDLLADDGVALVHSIGRTDGPGYTNPFIAKYIFPGGYYPALSEVLPVIERLGLIVSDIEVLRLHYADTLKAWRERFLANRARAAEFKGEEFCRMWEFYLAGSEAAFRWQQLMVFQLQLIKRIDALPVTRDYMQAAERRLAMRDSAGPDPSRMAGE